MTKKTDVGMIEEALDLLHTARDRAGDLAQRINYLKTHTDLSSDTISAVINDGLPKEKHLSGTDVDGINKGYQACEGHIPLSKKTTKALKKQSDMLNNEGVQSNR
ncbi:hypothetical protein ACWKWF_15305 [Acinetobacter kookii]